MKKHISLLVIFFILLFSSSGLMDAKKKAYGIIKMSKLLKGLDLYTPRTILKNREMLNLSQEQIEKIETEILSHEKYIIRTGAEIKIVELELVSLISQEKVQKTAITEKIRESGKLKTDSFIRHLNHLFKIKDILTRKQIGILIRKLTSSPEKVR